LAFSTISFHLRRSCTCSAHFVSLIFFRSFLTSSSHQDLGLPAGLPVNGFQLCILFTILISGILFMRQLVFTTPVNITIKYWVIILSRIYRLPLNSSCRSVYRITFAHLVGCPHARERESEKRCAMTQGSHKTN
jgi:hypothetical protein